MNMEKNPLDPFLDRIAELFQKIYQNRNKPIEKLPEGIDQQIEQLERDIALFCKMNEEILSKEQISEQELQETVQSTSDSLPFKGLEILERIISLKKEAESYQRDLAVQKESLKKDLSSQDQAKKRNLALKRKKKFKQIGGDKGWIPL